AEDGIRDFHVTGVQTCALPILIFADAGANMYPVDSSISGPSLVDQPLFGALNGLNIDTTADGGDLAAAGSDRYVLIAAKGAGGRSEERRVGKEGRSRASACG